jgi:hypothetical protein
MYNPWDHAYTAPHGNIDGGPLFGQPWEPTVTFWTHQTVPAAIPGQWDTVTHWLWDASDGLLHQITEDQAFVQQLWRHAKFGLSAPLPETPDTAWGRLGFTNLDYRITPDEMRAAVMDLPHVLADIQAAGYSEADVWAYTQAEAPWAVGLVGIA